MYDVCDTMYEQIDAVWSLSRPESLYISLNTRKKSLLLLLPLLDPYPPVEVESASLRDIKSLHLSATSRAVTGKLERHAREREREREREQERERGERERRPEFLLTIKN